MWSSSGRWSSRLGQDSRLRVGGEIRVVITFLVLLSQVTSSCIVSKFEYEGTLAQPWLLGNCTGFYCFSRTLFASVAASHEACQLDGFRMTMYLSAGYIGSSYSLWRVSVFCLLGLHAQKFLLYPSCAFSIYVPGVIECTVGPFAQPWSLWNCTCSNWFSYTFLPCLCWFFFWSMLIWWILHDNVPQCRFQRFTPCAEFLSSAYFEFLLRPFSARPWMTRPL